jgi:hypothetical protein
MLPFCEMGTQKLNKIFELHSSHRIRHLPLMRIPYPLKDLATIIRNVYTQWVRFLTRSSESAGSAGDPFLRAFPLCTKGLRAAIGHRNIDAAVTASRSCRTSNCMIAAGRRPRAGLAGESQAGTRPRPVLPGVILLGQVIVRRLISRWKPRLDDSCCRRTIAGKFARRYHLFANDYAAPKPDV